MLYTIIQYLIRAVLFLFYKKLFVNNKDLLNQNGPLLITTNHPNAFIDAIIIGVLFKKPIHFITRGDVFKKAWIAKVLATLNMIPIYRIRDGKENLHLNEYAFEKSKMVLANGGIVMIFIEGICKHTHDLQPLKKGAARIAFSCWNVGIDLKVLPASIRYSSLWKTPMNIQVNIGTLLGKTDLTNSTEEAKNYIHFNKIIFSALNNLLQQQNVNFNTTSSTLSFLKYIAFPFLFFLEKGIANKTKNNVFYHSFLFAAFFVLYPIYLITVLFAAYLIGFTFLSSISIVAAIVLLHIISIKQ